MAAITQNKSPVALPVNFCRAPKDYPRALVYSVQFDAVPSPQPFDLFVEISETEIDIIQSVFIDNSAQATSFQLLSSLFGTGPKIPANSQGWLPCACAQYPQFTAISGTANALVPLLFVNVPMPAMVWKSQ